MNSTNVFFINLKKDIGRRIWIKDIVNKLNGHIFEGISKEEIENGYLKSYPDVNKATQGERESKKELLKKFLKENKSEYIFIFEDDICVHKNFYNYLEEVNNFLITKKPKLFYFGVSKDIQPVSHDKLVFTNMRENFKDNPLKGLTGGFAFALHRNIIPFVLKHFNTTGISSPSDIHVLGQVILMHPEEVYITSPQLVIPNVEDSNIRGVRKQEYLWSNINIDENDYIIPKQKIFYVIIRNIEEFIGISIIIKVFTPIYKVVYICKKDDYEKLVKINEHIEFISVEDMSNIKITDKEYVICTSGINWKYYYGEEILKTINETKGSINFKIGICQKCRKANKDDYFRVIRQEEKEINIDNKLFCIHNHVEIKNMFSKYI
jgi:GR25 family glycosyltransferase involved in LPS biosynthesis